MLPQLPQDQANHALYGMAAGLVGAFFAQGFLLPAVGAVALACLVGVGKELADHLGDGKADVRDALATAAGGLVVGLATLM